MSQSEETSATSVRQQFLRNVGLGVLNDIKFRGRRSRVEQKKVVISTSRVLALSRCGVHILPILVSAAIIGVNLRQLFIGIDFASPIKSETVNMALLQVVAKLQELLIIASLATIVFQLLRDELLHGDGVPIGLIGAGINFTKLSFFWSSEWLGSLKGLFKGDRRLRKFQLGLFILLAGLLALFAGPACAVLLLPREDDWPAGGTTVYLNGAQSDFWPEYINASSTLEPICRPSTGVRYGVCPGGGFHSLWSHYARLDASTFEDVVPSYANDLSGNRYYWPIESTQPIKARVMSLGDPLQRFILQPHIPTVILLDRLMQEWWPALLKKHHWTSRNIKDRQAVTSNVWTPYVRVACSPAEVLTAEVRQLTFPTNEPSPGSMLVDNVSMPSGPSNHLTFTWVPLPDLRSVSTGAVLQSPWSSDNSSRLVTACSVQAQWTPTHLRTEAFTFWQGWYPKNVTFDHSYPKVEVNSPDRPGKSARNAIAVDERWLQMLTPETPVKGPAFFNWRPSTIESILSSIDLFQQIDGNNHTAVKLWDQRRDGKEYNLLASVIGSVIADGLSRYNIEMMYAIDSKGDPSNWAFQGYEKRDDFETSLLQGQEALKRPANNSSKGIQVNFAVSGLSYLNTLAQQLAMVVLFLHMIIALSHMLWTISRGKSSECWDSLTEIVVLAQNSKPAVGLQNTCAGIKCSQTFAKKVSIRPTKVPANASNADHLELLVEEEEFVGDTELMKLGSSTGLRQPKVQFRSRNVSSASQVTHASTWPLRRHDSIPSLHSMSSERPMEEITQPETPLLSSSHQFPTSVAPARVEDNCAYG